MFANRPALGISLTCGWGFDTQHVELITGVSEMASKTKRTEIKRRRKRVTSGKKRKAALRNKGTTKSRKALFGD